MKPAPFDYLRADDEEEALEALAEAGDDARLLAGGQTLMPMLNMRLVEPAVLIDISRLPGRAEKSATTAPSSRSVRLRPKPT